MGAMESWSVRVRRIASGRAGAWIIFWWAVAEAFMWPLIPDSALMAFTFAVPVALWRLWAWCVAGTVVGGTAGILLGRLGLAWPLPLVTERMRESVAGWLEVGASGLQHQPLSGVPYKVFVERASDIDVSIVDWALWTTLTRGSRMLVFGLIGAGAGLVLWRIIPERFRVATHVWVYAVGAVLLLTGLGLIVVSWS